MKRGGKKVSRREAKIPESKGPIEYQARAILGVAPDVNRREVILAFKGEPIEEDFDLGVRFPAGAVGALMLNLQAALISISKATADSALAMQPIALKRITAVDPILGGCALLFDLNGVNVPVVVATEFVDQMITEFQRAKLLVQSPPRPTKLS